IAVSALLLAGVMNSIVTHHRQARLQHEHRQCRLLAEAGMARGVALLASDAEYQGETWKLAADDMGYGGEVSVGIDASVGIKIERNSDEEPTQIVATTTLPATGTPRVTHTERMKP